MKKILVLLSMALATSGAMAQCGSDYLGTKTLYTPQQLKMSPPPAGYDVVFINHVGRHGARHLTKSVDVAYAYGLLAKADSAGTLTSNGQTLWAMVKRLQKVEQGGTKSITQEGKNELDGIGRRMYERYPSLFKDQKQLKIAVTKEIRTQQSAEAFVKGLNAKMKDTLSATFYNDDTDLRFYDSSTEYKKFVEDGNWRETMDKLEAAEHIADFEADFCNGIFKPEFAEKLSAANKDRFTTDIFGFAAIVPSLKYEIKAAGFSPSDLNIAGLFSCNQLKVLGEISNADENLKKGPGTNVKGIQVSIAAPLMLDFIKSSESMISEGKHGVQLRFAHAETIAPIAALMGIDMASTQAKGADDINKTWDAAKVIPLSSNIQWVFYKKRGGNKYLVKVLLNEKEVHINGLPKQNSVYYDYDKLRKFYLNFVSL